MAGLAVYVQKEAPSSAEGWGNQKQKERQQLPQVMNQNLLFLWGPQATQAAYSRCSVISCWKIRYLSHLSQVWPSDSILSAEACCSAEDLRLPEILCLNVFRNCSQRNPNTRKKGPLGEPTPGIPLRLSGSDNKYLKSLLQLLPSHQMEIVMRTSGLCLCIFLTQ